MQKYNSEPKQIKTKGKKEDLQHKQTNPKVSTQPKCPNQASSTHKI
jgi:hypothetical protein